MENRWGVQKQREENDDYVKYPLKTAARTLRIKFRMNAAGKLHDTGHFWRLEDEKDYQIRQFAV
jgi:hypothetical protein